MSSGRLLLTVAAVLCLQLPVAAKSAEAAKPAPAPPKQMINGWQIEQNSLAYGPVHVALAPNAIRLSGAKWHILAKAPDWNAFCYHDLRKICCTVPYKGWSLAGFPSIDLSFEATHAPPGGIERQVKYLNQPAVEKSWSGPAPKLMVMQDNDKETCLYTVTGFPFIHVSARATQLVERFYDSSSTSGFPARYTYFAQSNSKPRAVFETTSLTQVALPADIFDKPVGLKPTGVVSDIFLSKKNKKNMIDAGEMFGQ